VQESARATVVRDVYLKLPRGGKHPLEEPEKSDEVTFSGGVDANQDIEGLRLKILQMSDGLEP
jgi:hypothetical protein